MSEGGGDQQQELPGGGVDSDDALVADPSAMTHPPAPRRGCAFAAFVEAALDDVSNAAGICRGAHYKNVKAACQAALGERTEFFLSNRCLVRSMAMVEIFHASEKLFRSFSLLWALSLSLSLASKPLGAGMICISALSVEVDSEHGEGGTLDQIQQNSSVPPSRFAPLRHRLSPRQHRQQSASAAREASRPRWAPRTPTRSSRPSRGPRRRFAAGSRRAPPPSRRQTPGSRSRRSAACTSSSRTPTSRGSPPPPAAPLARAAAWATARSWRGSWRPRR